MYIDDVLINLNWQALRDSLSQQGFAITPPVLTPDQCAALSALYPEDHLFRSHIVMSRYRFGKGDYKYFAYPLPPLIQTLREQAYPPLAQLANEWAGASFPLDLTTFLTQCKERGQTRPTPLLLHYEAGDYNCLHQDLYGELAFPFQMACFLNRPGVDYTGGEFVMVEQQPRAQSRPHVITPEQGQIVIFTTRYRPVKGTRGYYRVNMRHGVSQVRSGTRYTLGIIFHDAE
ncbi:MAG: 2OG-Fe(II) oxygenase [Candidatus Solibacter usitatus]|nr:2OG-Fe(II) oxygenase [Candidatus Solibacter usitatus]